MSHRRRRPLGMLILPLFIGLIGFYRVAESPHFESYRTMDVAQILITGASIGGALVGLMLMFLRPWEAEGKGRTQEPPTASQVRFPKEVERQLDMPASQGEKMSHRRQVPFALLIFGLLMGLTHFLRVTGSPRFESHRTIDVIQLLITGVSIGVVLVGLIVMVLRPWEAKGNEKQPQP